MSSRESASTLVIVNKPKIGRPLKFKSAKQLQKHIDDYFAYCDPHYVEAEFWEHPEDSKGKRDKLLPPVREIRKVLSHQRPYTVTGLALFLGTSRELLNEYGDRPEFVDTIKAAKLKCQMFTEEFLFSGNQVAGAIFSLKNNYGWVDKSEVDNKHEVVQPILGGAVKDDVIEGEVADVHSDNSD